MLKLKVWDYFTSVVVFFVLTISILTSTQSVPFQIYIVFLYFTIVGISVMINFFFAASRYSIPDFKVKINLSLLCLVLVVFTTLAVFRLQSPYTYGGLSGYLSTNEYNWIQGEFIPDKANHIQGAWLSANYVYGLFYSFLALVFIFQLSTFGDIIKRKLD